MTTTTATTKADRYTNRAPKGGAISTVNGQWYAGGQFMPMVNAVVVEVKPVPLVGSSRQVAWANRLRREALVVLADEINVRRLFVADPRGTDVKATRAGLRRFLIEEHQLMGERSAASIIERRAELAW